MDPEPAVLGRVPDGGSIAVGSPGGGSIAVGVSGASTAGGSPTWRSPAGGIQQAQVRDALLRAQVTGGAQDGLDLGDFTA